MIQSMNPASLLVAMIFRLTILFILRVLSHCLVVFDSIHGLALAVDSLSFPFRGRFQSRGLVGWSVVNGQEKTDNGDDSSQ